MKDKSQPIPARCFPQVRIHPDHDERIRQISDLLLISRTDLISVLLGHALREFDQDKDQRKAIFQAMREAHASGEARASQPGSSKPWRKGGSEAS